MDRLVENDQIDSRFISLKNNDPGELSVPVPWLCACILPRPIYRAPLGIRYSTAKEPYFHGPTKHAINSRLNFSQFPDAIILNGFAVTLIIHQASHSH